MFHVVNRKDKRRTNVTVLPCARTHTHTHTPPLPPPPQKKKTTKKTTKNKQTNKKQKQKQNPKTPLVITVVCFRLTLHSPCSGTEPHHHPRQTAWSIDPDVHATTMVVYLLIFHEQKMDMTAIRSTAASLLTEVRDDDHLTHYTESPFTIHNKPA